MSLLAIVFLASLVPGSTTACGDYTQPLSTTMPNVLLIGDSISMPIGPSPGGYGQYAKDMLANHSIVAQHNGGWGKGGQASNTVKGLLCTNSSTQGNWLNFTGKFDLIHFNFGLHDLVDAGPGEGKEHVELPQYGLNLEEIYRRLATKSHKVMFTTTTPCPNVTTSMGRTNEKVLAYNHQALLSLRKVAPELLVDDLYSAVDSFCGEGYTTCSLQKPKNVHFTPEGCSFMGKEVTDSIIKALK
jgi:hypothetical protein